MKRSKTRTPYARGVALGAPFLLTALAAAAAGVDKPVDSKDAALAVLVAQASTAPATRAPAAAAPATQADKASAQVIEVTASKRKERLIDTPTALTAISNERLENLGVESFASYASLVPNLGVAGGSAPGSGAIVLRGLYTGPQQTTSTTAVYLGEAPFTSSGAFALGNFIIPDVDLFDVARVEVLKGPQGTLYGSTALGGLLRIVPKLPDTNTFGGNVKVGASKVSGGGDGYTGKASLSVPISPGLLALQVGAFSRQDGGFTTNTETRNKNLGKTNSEGGGLTVLLTPAQDLQFTLRALTQTLKSNGPTSQDNVLGTGRPVTGERQFASFVDLGSKSKYELVELGGEYRVDLGTLTGSLTKGKARLLLQSDLTSYTQFVQGLFGAPQTGRGLSAPDIQQDRHAAELRFASKRLGNVEFLAGLFTTDEDSDYFIDILGRNNANQPLPAPLNNIITSRTTGNYKESAVFGNVTFYATNDLDFSAGLRHAKNKQNFHLQSTGILGRPSSDIKSEDSSTTYQVTARYRPTKELSTFARVSTGYRPGGPQNNPAAPNPTFDPDTVTNYELGVKSSMLGGRLNFDASIYRIDWKKMQLNALLNGILIVGNAGKAKVDGFEVQASYSDPSGFSVGGSLGYNDAKLKEVGATTAASIGAAAGDTLPGSAKITAAMFSDYSFSIGGGLQGGVGATLRHQGSKHAAYSVPGALNPDFLMPAYSTLDLRASVRWDRYNLRLGIDNVTDKNGYSGYTTTRIAPTQTPASTAFLIRPRTVSATFGAEF